MEGSCFFFLFQENGMSQMEVVPPAYASEWEEVSRAL